MQREKLYDLVNAICWGCFQKDEILCNPFSYGQNLVAQSFVSVENNKCISIWGKAVVCKL